MGQNCYVMAKTGEPYGQIYTNGFKYDENFWRDFNVIPLEEEISKLIEKISLKIEEIGDWFVLLFNEIAVPLHPV